jgi:SAM-dependent methyltransferase
MRGLLPKAWRKRLVRATRRPRVGSVDWGALRRLEPFSRAWGGDRGRPIDRYYIEGFLEANAKLIRGTVLEIGDDEYSRRFGGRDVQAVEVLSSDTGSGVTWTADLAAAPAIPDDRFDCIILTQTLQFIPDTASAIETLHRVLAPAGHLLLTVPGISHSTAADSARWQDYWRFTPAALGWLLQRRFPADQVEVNGFGNVLSSAAFLYGLATDELQIDELDHADADYPLIVTARARKPPGGSV